MTPAEEADALALLRAMCEYAGCKQSERYSARYRMRGNGYHYDACGLGILRTPYCDTLLGEVLRRLRDDKWQMNQSIRSACIVFDVWKPGSLVLDGLPVAHEGSDPDHIILAVARAMRDAGIISTETKT